MRTVSTAETAKLVRKVLGREFPGAKFSVTSKRYAGGGSISVRWVDGPLYEEVQPLIQKYEGAGFDGMIDLKYYKTHWLRPNGDVLIEYSSGTENSTGSVPSINNRDLAPVIPADAELVRFSADYVHCQRGVSNFEERLYEAQDWVYDNCHIDQKDPVIRDPQRDRFGREWVADVARRIINNQREGEELRTGFNRALSVITVEG